MKFLMFWLVCSTGLSSFGQKGESYLLAGTYTTGKSEGIYIYRFSSSNANFDSVSMVKTSNPSFLAVSPNKKFVYAVNEDKPGTVTSFSFEKKSGILTELNKRSSAGDHPCYITVDKTGKWVITGNYSSGTLSVVGVKKDGSFDSVRQVIEHSGYSVNSDRQQGPHVHCTTLAKNNDYLFVPDLGIDKTMIYQFNDKTGRLEDGSFPYASSEPGAGPRHLEFHPNGKFAYLIEELNGTVSVFYYLEKNGQLNMIQTISALPPEYQGPAGSADIHVSPDGKFLYASNRAESNTIAIFAINKQNGLLQLIGHQPTMGKTPRNFSLDPSGNFLLVANQNSDEIVIFRRNKETGWLADTGKRIHISQPVCIRWISTY